MPSNATLEGIYMAMRAQLMRITIEIIPPALQHNLKLRNSPNFSLTSAPLPLCQHHGCVTLSRSSKLYTPKSWFSLSELSVVSNDCPRMTPTPSSLSVVTMGNLSFHHPKDKKRNGGVVIAITLMFCFPCGTEHTCTALRMR